MRCKKLHLSKKALAGSGLISSNHLEDRVILLISKAIKILTKKSYNNQTNTVKTVMMQVHNYLTAKVDIQLRILCSSRK